MPSQDAQGTEGADGEKDEGRRRGGGEEKDLRGKGN